MPGFDGSLGIESEEGYGWIPGEGSIFKLDDPLFGAVQGSPDDGFSPVSESSWLAFFPQESRDFFVEYEEVARGRLDFLSRTFGSLAGDKRNLGSGVHSNEVGDIFSSEYLSVLLYEPLREDGFKVTPDSFLDGSVFSRHHEDRRRLWSSPKRMRLGEPPRYFLRKRSAFPGLIPAEYEAHGSSSFVEALLVSLWAIVWDVLMECVILSPFVLFQQRQ